MSTALEKLFQEAIQVQLYPRTVINVTIHILAQDGGLYSACVNSATLALLDAGIAMYDYVSCIGVCMAGNNPLLDPCNKEEQEVPLINVGIVGKSDKISLLMIEDRLSLDKLESSLAVGLEGCKSMRDLMDKEVRRHGKSLNY